MEKNSKVDVQKTIEKVFRTKKVEISWADYFKKHAPYGHLSETRSWDLIAIILDVIAPPKVN